MFAPCRTHQAIVRGGRDFLFLVKISKICVTSDHFGKLYPTYTSPYKGEEKNWSSLMKWEIGSGRKNSRDVGTIGGQSGEATIIQRAANRKMIERLPLGLRMNPEYPMHRIIKETPDTR